MPPDYYLRAVKKQVLVCVVGYAVAVMGYSVLEVVHRALHFLDHHHHTSIHHHAHHAEHQLHDHQPHDHHHAEAETPDKKESKVYYPVSYLEPVTRWLPLSAVRDDASCATVLHLLFPFGAPATPPPEGIGRQA